MAVQLPPGARIPIVDTIGGQIGALAAFAEADLERGLAFNDSWPTRMPTDRKATTARTV